MSSRLSFLRQSWLKYRVASKPLTTSASNASRTKYSLGINRNEYSLRRCLALPAPAGHHSQGVKCFATHIDPATQTPPQHTHEHTAEHKQEHTAEHKQEHTAEHTQEHTQEQSADTALATLQMKLERLGSLHIQDVGRAVRALEGCRDVGGEDVLRLLHFTLRAVEDEFRPCNDAVQRVWQLLEARGIQPSLAHVLEYFRICVLTDVPVDAKDVLHHLKNYDIGESRELVELATLVLGWRGDMAGVLEVLALVKAQGVPITETVFSALIICHGRNGDPAGIASVLDTMRSVKMTPSSVTYEALMVAHTAAGQPGHMRQVVHDMRQDRVGLSQTQLLTVLLNVIKSGQAGQDFDNIDFVVRLFSGEVDVGRVVLQCIYQGHVREAFHLLPSQPRIAANNHLYSNGLVYVRHLVHARVEPDLVVEMCDVLRQKDINQYALEGALEVALGDLREPREQLAWVLLRALRDRDRPLRQHYFWPVIHHHALKNDPTKLVECLRQMSELGVPPDLESLKDHAVPGLIINQPLLTLAALSQAGVQRRAAATAVLCVLLRNNMVDLALDFVRADETRFSMMEVSGVVARAWAANPARVTQLMAALIQKDHQASGDGPRADWGGQMLLDLVSTRRPITEEQLTRLLTEFEANNIGVSEGAVEALCGRGEGVERAVRQGAGRVLDASLGRPPKEKEYNLLPHPSEMSVDELESHLVELRARGMNRRGVLRRLLLLHAQAGTHARVTALMQEAEGDGMELSAGMLASILDTYRRAGNVDAALHVLQEVQARHPTFKLDLFKVLDLCTAMVQAGRVDDCLNTLQKYLSGNTLSNIAKGSVRRNCRALLTAAAEQRNYELTFLIFEELHTRGLVDADPVMLGPLIKARINSGDVGGAVGEARRIYSEHRCLPMRVELMTHLVTHAYRHDQKVESDLLQEVMDMCVKTRGANQSLHDLLFACVEAHQPGEARKVLQSMGRGVNMAVVGRQCERYAKHSRPDPLLHLIEASRRNPAVNQLVMYKALLNIYYVENAGAKGLSLWTMMQEDNLTPSPAFLATLASLLSASNIKIPFTVPDDEWTVKR